MSIIAAVKKFFNINLNGFKVLLLLNLFNFGHTDIDVANLFSDSCFTLFFS
jgi:hypothetical protein